MANAKTLLITLILLTSIVTAFSNEKEICITVKKGEAISLFEVTKQLMNNTEYIFSYNLTKKIKEILIKETICDSSIESFLNKVLKGKNLQANIDGSTITFVEVEMKLEPGQIHGYLYSKDKPIKEINIKLFKDEILLDSVLTNTNGEYNFQNVTPGSYTLKASITDKYLIRGKHQIYVNLSSGEKIINNNFSIDFKLVSFSGTVNEDLFGNQSEFKPVEAILVKCIKDSNGNEIRDFNETVVDSVITNDKGEFSFHNLEWSNYIVQLDNQKYYDISFEGKKSEKADDLIDGLISITENDSTIRYVLKYCDGKIEGRITFETNKDSLIRLPLAEKNILLIADKNGDSKYSAEDERINTTQTNENGVYEFSNVPMGKYLVGIIHKNKLNCPILVNINRSEPENKNIVNKNYCFKDTNDTFEDTNSKIEISPELNAPLTVPIIRSIRHTQPTLPPFSLPNRDKDYYKGNEGRGKTFQVKIQH